MLTKISLRFAVTCAGLLVMASAIDAQHPPWGLGAGAHLGGDWVYDPVRADIPDAAWADVTIPAAGARSDYGAGWTAGAWWQTYIIHGPPLSNVDMEVHGTLNGWMSGAVNSPGEEFMVTVGVYAGVGEIVNTGDAHLVGYVTESGPNYEYHEWGALQGLGLWNGAGNVTFNQASVVLLLRQLPVNEPFVLFQDVATTTSVIDTTSAGTNFVDTYRHERFVLPLGYSITAIPEPPTLMLAGLGALMILRRRQMSFRFLK